MREETKTKQNKKISLCIFQLIVFRERAGFDQVIVDAVGLDGVYQFHYRQTAADLLVLIDTFQLRLQQQSVPLPGVLLLHVRS